MINSHDHLVPRSVSMRRFASNVLNLLLVASALCSVSVADYQGGTSPLFTHSGWNYAATTFIDSVGSDTVQKFYWCGQGSIPGRSSTDVIYYRYYDYTSGQWSAITEVLAPTYGSWEDNPAGAGTCNPTVVKGTFSPGNGNNYIYALYYVAGESQTYGNHIGVAFSNDGMTWTKYSGNPIIAPQGSIAGDDYGAGEPSAYNSNGSSAINLFQYDDTLPGHSKSWWRSSSDGIHFSTATAINLTTQVGPTQWPTDVGFDYNTNTFYAVIGWYANGGTTAGFGIYKAPATSVYSGTGTWTFVGVVDLNLTGVQTMYEPKFYRDTYGNVTYQLPNIAMTFGGGTNNPSTSQIYLISQTAQPNTLAFQRDLNSGTNLPYGDNWVTTGAFYLSGYSFQGTMGYLYMAPQTGTVPLYDCIYNQDHFVSPTSNCEGQFVLGINGWVYSSPPQGIATSAIYRCLRSGGQNGIYHNHFVSFDPHCEGFTTELLLGYSKNSQ
jgi:hypothetical protein